MPASSNNRSAQRMGRFSRLDLRCNPFRVAEASELPALYVPPSGQIADGSAPVIQIIGRRGRGKSTQLAVIEHSLAEAGVVCERRYIGPEAPCRLPRPASDTEVLLVDEAQRLSWVGWRTIRRLLRKPGRRLIVGTHADVSRHLRRRKFLLGTGAWPVETVCLPEVDVSRLQALFRRRIEWAGGDTAQYSLGHDAAEWLIRRCGGNLRTIEMALYEVFQTLEPIDLPVTVETRHLQRCRDRVEEFIAEARRLESTHR